MNKEKVEELVPKKIWFSLREVCELKNLNYKSACNKKATLQPNKGLPDAYISGRKMFNRETVLDWLMKSDDELKENSLEDPSCKK
jgi:hypothetical protein